MKEDILIEARNHAYVDHPIPLSVLCDLIVEVEKLRGEVEFLRSVAGAVSRAEAFYSDPAASQIMKDCSSFP